MLIEQIIEFASKREPGSPGRTFTPITGGYFHDKTKIS